MTASTPPSQENAGPSPGLAPPLADRRGTAGSRWTWLVAMLTVLLAVSLSTLSHRRTEREGMEQLLAVGNERLALYAAALETELARLTYLPALVASDEDVLALLREPSKARQTNAERKLARMNARAGSRLIYLVGTDGRLVANSEGPTPDAAQARLERIAQELRTNSQGLFAAEVPEEGTDHFQLLPVQTQGRVWGWVVVGTNLAPLETSWVDLAVRTEGEKLMVVDRQDVVVMSSVPTWKYRTLSPVLPRWHRDQQDSLRYPPQPMSSLGFKSHDGEATALRVVEFIPTEGARSGPYLAQRRYVPGLAVQFITLSDPSKVWRAARVAVWTTAAIVGLAGLLVIYLLHRRRVLVQLYAARNDLQRARDDLERQVALRTRELVSANAELERQIERRRLSEDELLQASKMAVLGQMSAGMAHELNQPLTALRALAGNTLQLIRAGRMDVVERNLAAISDAADRMGRITTQLKTFARRASDTREAVSLAAAIENVRLLLAHRLDAEGVSFGVQLPEGCAVIADSTRLEQVLLNLASNALDAMQGLPQRRLRFEAQQRGERVEVRVCDTGVGMTDTQMARLFEPFFTTKPAGQGLGLGLVISSKIVSELGGALQAHRGEQGMVFQFDLAAARSPQHV